MKSWQREAEKYARELYMRSPQEACGLVVDIGGVHEFVPCANKSQRPNTNFEISPEDFVRAEELGVVIAVFHSHPNDSCNPSVGDQMTCEASKLPYYIIGLPDGKWGYCEPTGREMPYERRPFIHGTLDCYTLVRDWYRRERKVDLPDYDRLDEWWRRGQNLYVEHFEEAGFKAIPAKDALVGDVLLFQISSPVPNHAAVMIGDMVMLHHMHSRLSEKTVYGGFWRERTTHFLRYTK